MQIAVMPGMTRAILFVVLTGLALAGCGQSVSGTYLPAGTGMSAYQKLEFASNGTVDMTTMFGSTMQSTYKIDGEKMVITVTAGASLVFTVDGDGCLNGGIMGKYCRK